MTMISFAQNGEDVMLMRALRDVERGFYIDAGAWEPTQDSVTRAFYDRGWRGINIEPSPEPAYADWEPILLGADYRFAWFDGLNRFYVAGERAEALLPHFQVQPNVFDDFRRHDAGLAALVAERDALAASVATGTEGRQPPAGASPPTQDAMAALRRERDALAERLRLAEAASPMGVWWRWVAPWWGVG